MTIWPRKHKRKTPSQAFTRSKQIYRIGRSLKYCGTVHSLLFWRTAYIFILTLRTAYGLILTLCTGYRLTPKQRLYNALRLQLKFQWNHSYLFYKISFPRKKFVLMNFYLTERSEVKILFHGDFFIMYTYRLTAEQ